MTPRPFALCAALAVLPTSGARAFQDDGSEQPPQDGTAQSVSRFFQALHDEEVLFEGGVRRDEADAKDPFGGIMMVMGPGGGSSSDPFEGDFTALSTDRGERLIVSRERLPGFSLYSNGESTLVSTLTDTKGMDLSRPREDLPALMDFASLARHAAGAEWKVSDLGDVGPRVLSASLKATVIPIDAKQGGPFGGDMFSERIVGVDVRLTVSENGDLRSMEFSVHRTDPMAAMQEMAMEQIEAGGGIGAGGESSITLDPTDIGGLENGPTQATHYKFKLMERQPGRALTAKVEEMREIIANR